MKRLFFVLALLFMLASGCLSNNADIADMPVPYPAGTFSGEFRRISRKSDMTIDTLKANIKVVIEPGVGYQILGDTLTLHAGSKGQYSIAGNDIKFIDDTYPKTGTPLKTHLDGEYIFIYNGSVFQMTRTTENLALQYDLRKTN